LQRRRDDRRVQHEAYEGADASGVFGVDGDVLSADEDGIAIDEMGNTAIIRG